MIVSNNSFFATSQQPEQAGIPYKIELRKKQIIAQLTITTEITINEIASLLGISAPTANELILSLLKDGLVKDTGKRLEGVGRRATIYKLA